MPSPARPADAFAFSYDSTTRCLRVHWPGTVTDESLRAHYADLLTTASAHGNCCFWLLDLRQRNWHAPRFGEWFGSVFAAAAHAALHQPLFIAYVLSPEHHVVADTPGTQATQRACAIHDVYPFFFDSEEAAQAWLTHQQAHDR